MPDWLNCSPNMAPVFACRIPVRSADGLFELRPRCRLGIGRAFYCFVVGKRVVVLHAFVKKVPPDARP